jgi:hypothetical protein
MTPLPEILGISRRRNLTQRYIQPSLPFFFSFCTDPQQLLVSEGFEVMNISLVPRPTLLAGHLLEWLRLFTKVSTFFQGIDSEETELMLREAADICEVDAKDVDGDRWMLMYVRLRVLARRAT